MVVATTVVTSVTMTVVAVVANFEVLKEFSAGRGSSGTR